MLAPVCTGLRVMTASLRCSARRIASNTYSVGCDTPAAVFGTSITSVAGLGELHCGGRYGWPKLTNCAANVSKLKYSCCTRAPRLEPSPIPLIMAPMCVITRPERAVLDQSVSVIVSHRVRRRPQPAGSVLHLHWAV